MSEKDTKPLLTSGSFWALIAASLWGIDWDTWLPQVAQVMVDVVPPEYHPIVKAAVALLIAIYGIVRVKNREKKIKGVVFSPPKPRLP